MSFYFLDSSARSAWLAATTQQAQLEGLRDLWSGQMSVRYYSPTDAHLATVTHATPIIDTTTTPYSLRLGAWVAESHVQDGTAAYCVLAVPAGADILRCDVSLAGAISDPGGRVRLDIGTTLRVQATASLPLGGWMPEVGYRSNINANSASAVDYDLTSGEVLADRWWNGYNDGNSFASMVWSYSGTIWAPDYGTAGGLVVHGGGHGGNIGPFGYVFDIATRQWVCVGAPGNVPSTSVWCGYVDARDGIQDDSATGNIDLRDLDWLDYNYSGSYLVISDHEYLQNAYVSPAEGGGTYGSLYLPQATYSQSNGVSDPRTGGTGLPYVWAPHLMDLQTGVMTRATSATLGTWGSYSASSTVRDTTRNRLWVFRQSTASCHYHDLDSGPPYTTTSHTIQKAGGGNAGWCYVANCTSVYVPEADAIVTFAPDNQNSAPPAVVDTEMHVVIYTMGTGLPVDQETFNTITTQAMPYGGLYVGATWVPASVVGGVGKFYLYEGFGDTFAYTLTPSTLNFATCTWAWGAESFANSHTGADPVAKATYDAGNAQAQAVLNKWQFVPDLGVIAWHDGPTTSAACFDGVARDGIVQFWRPPGTPI